MWSDPAVMDIATCARIAAELETCRTLARRLCGHNYAARVAPWRDVVRASAARFGCRPIEVPLRMEEELGLPENPLLLFAAVVDEMEARGRDD